MSKLTYIKASSARNFDFDGNKTSQITPRACAVTYVMMISFVWLYYPHAMHHLTWRCVLYRTEHRRYDQGSRLAFRGADGTCQSPTTIYGGVHADAACTCRKCFMHSPKVDILKVLDSFDAPSDARHFTKWNANQQRRNSGGCTGIRLLMV